MSLSDEEMYHFDESYMHIQFFRDLLRRTGLVEAFNQYEWYYGYDYNGTGQIVAVQLDNVVNMLSCMECSLDTISFESTEHEVWDSWTTLDGINIYETEVAQWDLAFMMEFLGDADEVCMWKHFLKWLCPKDVFLIDPTKETPHFMWLVSYDEYYEIHDKWSNLITVWEVLQFVEHTSDKPAWRRLRDGFDSTGDYEEQTATIRNQDERNISIQKRGTHRAADFVRQLNDGEATGTSGCSYASTAAAS